MSIKTYIRRGLRYIVTGSPIQQTQVQIVHLTPTELLKGRKALITGGTSGIGYAIAIAFIKAGADVVITSRSKKNVIQVVEKIRKTTGSDAHIYGIELDTRDVNTFEDKLKEVTQLSGIGRIDILVNNAGINKNENSQTLEKSYDDIMDTNLKGCYFLSQVISDYMVEEKIEGNILNIASASSLRPANNPYVLSKWGIRALTLGFAKKYIKKGIVVNGLAPGPTATPMLNKTESDDISLPNNPSGRYALPEEIANMAVILTSQIGRTIVGDIIYMTGGAGILTYDDIKY